MIIRCLALIFIELLIFAANFQTIRAQIAVNNSVDKNKAEKIKAEVLKRGTGKTSIIVVKMNDGTQLKGYISQAIEDSFDLTNPQTKEFTTIPYRDVMQVKSQGLSKKAKIAIGIGVAAVITVLVLTAPANKPIGNICPLGC
jgi:hypothetical protein